MGDQFSTIEQALATRGSLEPERLKGVSVGPMGGLMKLLVPDTALAGFNPLFNTLRYRKEGVEGMDRAGVEDVLEHELTHADQRRREGFLGSLLSSARSLMTPYREREHEKEAYATSGRAHTKYRLNDVQLPDRRRAAMEKVIK